MQICLIFRKRNDAIFLKKSINSKTVKDKNEIHEASKSPQICCPVRFPPSSNGSQHNDLCEKRVILFYCCYVNRSILVMSLASIYRSLPHPTPKPGVTLRYGKSGRRSLTSTSLYTFPSLLSQPPPLVLRGHCRPQL